MRAAIAVAGSLIAIGIYLVVASTLALTPTWIALGMLAIALTASITLVAGDRPSTP